MRFSHLFVLIFALVQSSAFAVIYHASLAPGVEGLGFNEVVFTSDKVNAKDPSVVWQALGAPPGIRMDSKGKYVGMPTKHGNFTISVSVSTKVGSRLILRDATTINHTINATNPPTINGSFTLPSGQYDQRYQQLTGGHRLTATGDYPFPSNSKYPTGFHWELIKGESEFQSLPQGLSLSPHGVISGVPTSRAPVPTSNQTYTFRVKATDMVGKSSTANFTMVAQKAIPPQILSQCPLPDGLEQTVYKNQQLQGINGKPPYNWTIQPISNFPAGLKLDNKTGIISGKPSSYGNYTFSIVLRDTNGFSVNKSCTMTVHPIPHITTTAIFDCATVGKEVCSVIEAIGGAPPYTWEISPPMSGVTITPSGSKTKICGNFTTNGSKSVTVKVTDPKTKKSTTKSFAFSVTPPLQITTANPLQTGKVGETYIDLFTATGGKPPYTWQILPQLYVSDLENHRIRKFYEGGNITTYAGNGINASIDGNQTTSSFSQPYGMGFDPHGNIYLADFGTSKIRKISVSGNVTTVGGTSAGYRDGSVSIAQFNKPEDMVADENGNCYVADYMNHKIRKIDKTGNVITIAGASAGFSDGNGNAAKFHSPQGFCWDLDGDLILADMSNHAIRKITTTGSVTTVAGSASSGFADGTVQNAKFNGPHDVKVGNDGTIYVVDHSNAKIRKIAMDGKVSTLANVNSPNMLSVDKNGFVYVSDHSKHLIYKITPGGVVSTIAGKGGSTPFIDNVPALQATFNSPRSIEINPYEDLPVGLTLNATSGKISGTPEAYGLYNLTYRVTDSCGNSAISNCTLTINSRKPEFDFELPWKFTDTGAIASGHTGALRNYTSNTMPAGALWTVNSDNLTLKVAWENSSNCAGGNNSNTQSATATINMTTTKPQKVGLSWSGIGELEESGFENMEVYIDGNLIGKAQAAGGNKGCAMGPVVSVNNYPNGYTLPAGNHTILINATTKDRFYHTGAYYQFTFTSVE
jgi:sugar lactone lactonase YvrE